MSLSKRSLLCTALLVAAHGFSAPKAHAAAEPLVGEIMYVGFNFCPRGWMEANGQLLAISSNTALFSLLGTTYGGDGRTTFALPDLRGRVPVSAGQGPGLDPYSQGERGGREEVFLNSAQLPAHSHGLGNASVTLHANKQGGETPAPEGKMLADGQRAAFYSDAPAAPEDKVALDTGSASLSGSTDAFGSNQPVENLHPYVVLRACIAVQGVFPSRS